MSDRIDYALAPKRYTWQPENLPKSSIEVKGKCIGLRSEPLSTKKSPSQCKWQEQFEATHKRFAKEFGGKVFIVYSVARGKAKEIQNPEVIEDIRQELKRLRKQ